MPRPSQKPGGPPGATNSSSKGPTRPPPKYNGPQTPPKTVTGRRTKPFSIPAIDRKHITRSRSRALIGVGVVVLTTTFFVSFSAAAYLRDAKHYASVEIPADVSDRYKSPNLAEAFDGDVDTMEWMMGMNNLRRELLGRARGHVLEASAGTGRNTEYFPLTAGVKSVTMVDASEQMIQVARIKWAKKNAWFINALFRVQSAADPVPFPAEGGFDTVVQTMGLCSTPEPERLLRNLGDMCKDDGEARIFLLEHGRGHYDWMNRWIDKFAPAHADRHGCWFNKDIGEIVRSSGLEIVEQRRYHFGTTWWFELKPAPKQASSQGVVADNIQSAAPAPWWWSWWK